MTTRMVQYCSLPSFVALTGFIWVLQCSFPSAGSLSKPENLKVDILDFIAKVFWESGPGNPVNSTYMLEMQHLWNESWTEIEKCTFSTLMCVLDDFKSDDLITNYFVRVKAIWKNESSEWANAGSFQPYANTRFSPPLLNVVVQGQSLFAEIHHPVKEKAKNLKFAISLYRNFSGQMTKVAENKSLNGSYSVHNLPLGRYCLRASIYNDMEDHPFAEECVVLHPADRWTSVHVTVAVSFFLAVAVGLILFSVLCYLLSRQKYLRTPEALIIRDVHRNVSYVLEITHEMPRALMISQTLDHTNDCVLAYEEVNRQQARDNQRGSSSVRDMISDGNEGAICWPPEQEKDDECTGSLCFPAGYGHEDILLADTSYTAPCLDDSDEYSEDRPSSVYMKRLRVGGQWQVHVLLSSQSISRLESPETTIEATKVPLNSSSDYEPRLPVACYDSYDDSQ